jgi:hypothetical protein
MMRVARGWMLPTVVHHQQAFITKPSKRAKSAICCELDLPLAGQGSAQATPQT